MNKPYQAVIAYLFCLFVYAKSASPATDITYWESEGYGYVIKKSLTELTF